MEESIFEGFIQKQQCSLGWEKISSMLETEMEDIQNSRGSKVESTLDIYSILDFSQVYWVSVGEMACNIMAQGVPSSC